LPVLNFIAFVIESALSLVNNSIRNLVFDLGGVIIDLDFEASHREFSRLSGLTVNEVVRRTQGFSYFLDYETGAISSPAFRQKINNLLEMTASDQQIDLAWCAMLRGIPEVRLKLLKSLQAKYRIFALSNTNDIHANTFNTIVQDTLGSAVVFKEHFDKVYYSHEMNMRKPDEAIYQAVLHDQGLRPGETLFIDDTLENIQTAETLGIRTLHLEDPGQLIPFFDGDW
jgi:putative hydrolase of the HAD superfamily